MPFQVIALLIVNNIICFTTIETECTVYTYDSLNTRYGRFDIYIFMIILFLTFFVDIKDVFKLCHNTNL